MLDAIVNYFYALQWNSTLVIALYIVPMATALGGHFRQFVKDYQSDLENYQKSYYDPALTVGSILGRLLISVIPVINLWPGIRYSFTLGYDIVYACVRALDIPLIRHNPKPIVSTPSEYK